MNGNSRNPLWHPGVYATVIVFKIKKIWKHFEKISKNLGTNKCKFSTFMQKFGRKWHFMWYVQKRQNLWPKWDLKIHFSEHIFCLFCTYHIKCHLLSNYYTNIENMYMFMPKKIQIFLMCFHIFKILINVPGAYAPGS